MPPCTKVLDGSRAEQAWPSGRVWRRSPLATEREIRNRLRSSLPRYGLQRWDREGTSLCCLRRPLLVSVAVQCCSPARPKPLTSSTSVVNNSATPSVPPSGSSRPIAEGSREHSPRDSPTFERWAGTSAPISARSHKSARPRLTQSALPLTRVSPFRLSTVTWMSYQGGLGLTPKRLVNSTIRSSVNQASAEARFQYRAGARGRPGGRTHAAAGRQCAPTRAARPSSACSTGRGFSHVDG